MPSDRKRVKGHNTFCRTSWQDRCWRGQQVAILWETSETMHKRCSFFSAACLPPYCLIWTLWGAISQHSFDPCTILIIHCWQILSSILCICHIASQAKQKDALGISWLRSTLWKSYIISYIIHSYHEYILDSPVTWRLNLHFAPLCRFTCVALPVNAPTSINKYPTASLVVAQAHFQRLPISQYAHQKFMGRAVGVQLQNQSSGIASRMNSYEQFRIKSALQHTATAWDLTEIKVPNVPRLGNDTSWHVPCLAKRCPQYILPLGSF